MEISVGLSNSWHWVLDAEELKAVNPVGEQYVFKGVELEVVYKIDQGISESSLNLLIQQSGLNQGFMLRMLELGMLSEFSGAHIEAGRRFDGSKVDVGLIEVLVFIVLICWQFFQLLAFSFIASADASNSWDILKVVASIAIPLVLFALRVYLHEYAHYFAGLLAGIVGGRVEFLTRGRLGAYRFPKSNNVLARPKLFWVWIAGPLSDTAFQLLVFVMFIFFDMFNHIHYQLAWLGFLFFSIAAFCSPSGSDIAMAASTFDRQHGCRATGIQWCKIGVHTAMWFGRFYVLLFFIVCMKTVITLVTE